MRRTVFAVAASACLAIGMLVSAPASAHPGYPAVVKDALGLPAIVDGPLGCHLCHVSDGGGGPLRAFGTLLVQTYGLSPEVLAEHDDSLRMALTGLAMGEPAVVDELRKGQDPNDAAASGGGGPSLGSVETPTYGCALADRRSSRGAGILALGLAGLVAAVLSARRRRPA
jgi:hypothetical protein